MNISKIRSIVDDNSTKSGKLFDYVIQILIILSLFAFAAETLPDNSSKFINFLHGFEILCIVVFSLEYLLRIIIAKKSFSYIFSFYGLIDFLAIIPYYLASFDLRFLRVFRVFRVFRAFRLTKYNKALERFRIAFKLVKEELYLFLIVIIILLFIVSAGIYFFENQAQPENFKSIFHSSWWNLSAQCARRRNQWYPQHRRQPRCLPHLQPRRKHSRRDSRPSPVHLEFSR